MRWLGGAVASCAGFAFAVAGTFEPLRDEQGVEYVFAAPAALTLVWLVAVVLVVLALLFVAIAARARRLDPTAHPDAARRWLAPLCVPGIVVLGLAPAIPGIGVRAAPLGYYFYDLRWWWLAGAVLASAIRVDRSSGYPIERRLRAVEAWPVAARLLLIDAVLFASVIGVAIVSTPRLRFSGALHGDETKYIRYGEVWYQGGGFDISSKRLFADERLDASPQIHRIPLNLARAVREESGALLTDLGRFIADPFGFHWNRSHGDDAFVEGKRGGMYQIYQPGLSFVIFPGYFIDRYLLGIQPGYQDEFPAELVMTNVMLLLVYGAAAVALFRLLRRVLGSEPLAMVWAAVALVTLPTAAFPFQFYPELPALLIIILSSLYALFAAREAGRGTAAAFGATTAFLAWLHPRFLLVSIVMLMIGAARSQDDRRRILLIAAGAVYLSVGAFDYRVTGSWLPTALWDASRPNEAVHPVAVPLNLLGYAFHRTWGLAAHTPILLAAVPGFALVARESWRQALSIAAIALALILPAASHTLSAAGGTPGRLVLAVVPLLIWPIAIVVRRFWQAAGVRMITVALVVISLDTALTYNWNHEKAIGPLRAAGLSGWRPNLLFPVVRDEGWTAVANLGLLIACALVVVAAAALASRKSTVTLPASGGGRLFRTAALAVLAVIALSTIVGAATGHWAYDSYFVDRVDAQREAARGLLSSDRCRLCFSSRRRAIDWTVLEPNPARGTRSTTIVDGGSLRLNVTVERDGPWASFGRARIDFGDRSATAWTGIVDAWQVTHRYDHPGRYDVSVWFQLRDGDVQVERQTVTVGG